MDPLHDSFNQTFVACSEIEMWLRLQTTFQSSTQHKSIGSTLFTSLMLPPLLLFFSQFQRLFIKKTKHK